MKGKEQFYVVKEKAVPEVLLKVVEAKKLLETGRAATVQEASDMTGISRSSFYKYKDDISLFHENTKGKKITFFAILATIMIPFQAIMLPVYLITLKLHLTDNVNNFAGFMGLIMPFAVSAFGIFLMRQAFLGIPKEMEEAAIVDGCNVFQVFWKVLMPMVKPSLAVLAIFTFIGSWGEFLWPSIVLTKEAMYTLPVGVNNLQGMFSSNWRFIAAGSILSTIPILIFFLAMQRYFISGENEGAVKG